MKHSDLSKLVRANMLALCLGMLPLATSAYAQTNGNVNTTNANTTRTVVREEDGTDWGWIGLIGLAGLAGLLPRKRAVEVRDHDPGMANRSTAR
jgi:hypothetical protein